jgi:hypothetical protein
MDLIHDNVGMCFRIGVTARLKAENTFAGTLLIDRFSDAVPLQGGRIAESAHQIYRCYASQYRARENGTYD